MRPTELCALHFSAECLASLQYNLVSLHPLLFLYYFSPWRPVKKEVLITHNTASKTQTHKPQEQKTKRNKNLTITAVFELGIGQVTVQVLGMGYNSLVSNHQILLPWRSFSFEELPI